MRRRSLLLAASALAINARAAGAAGQPPRRLDLTGCRRTFSVEFKDPEMPLSVRRGGPFTTRYEEWGGLRTLPGNDELELYVDRRWVPSAEGTDKAGHDDAPPGAGHPFGYDPFEVRDGCLFITAVPASPALRARTGRPYLSGMISTEWSFTQRFGYFEIRTQLPPGRGLWPAFWMVSKTHAEHVEIDVFEAIGEGNRIYQSLHVQPARGTGVLMPRYVPFDYSDGLHDYGVLWTPSELVYFVDGVETARTDATRLQDAPPMYLIANLAVGGTWPGAPPAATHFPAAMRIAHIRAYQAQ